jgi:hypothetical protein
VIGRDTKIIGVNEVLIRVTDQAMAMAADTDDPKRPFSSVMLLHAQKYGCSKELAFACRSALEAFDEAEEKPEA